MRCTYCGSGRHIERYCPKTHVGSTNRQYLRCTYCGASDHCVEACPKTHGGNAARAWHPDSVADHFIKDR